MTRASHRFDLHVVIVAARLVLVADLGVRGGDSARPVLLLLPAHHDARTRREEDHEDERANSDANDERYTEIGRRVGADDFDNGLLFDRDAQRGGGGVGGAEAGGERGLHLVSSLGGGHGDGGGDEHAGGGDADRDERLVDASNDGDLLLPTRLVAVRVVADAAAGR